MINEIEIDHIMISKDLQELMDLDSSFLEWAVNMVELLTNLEFKRKNGNKETKIAIMKLILVELFIDTKKQLHIQENELFEYIKIYKIQYGGAYRQMMELNYTNLYRYLVYNNKKFFEVYEVEFLEKI